MSEVIPLFGGQKNNSLAISPEEKAQYLEGLAARVRSGEIEIERAMMVYTDYDGAVGVEPFGEHSTWIQLAGMLAFASNKVIVP